MGGTCSTPVLEEKCYNNLIGKSEREKPLKSSRISWQKILEWILGK
jgi:hypothetical protein